MSNPKHVTVIGAGMVGIGCAAYLQRDGHRVTVVDPDAPGSNTSFGNAGAIAGQACIPQSLPGTLAQVPKYLLDPLGPLAIRWSYLPWLAPWLLKFRAAGKWDRVQAISRAMRALHAPVLEAHRTLAKDAGATDFLHQSGSLVVYEKPEAFDGDQPYRDMQRAQGIEVDDLSGDELRQLEPALSSIFTRATYYPEGAHCANPGGYIEQLANSFRANGGEILARRVTGFDTGSDGPRKVQCEGGDIDTDVIVIAAGAWSVKLTGLLGDTFPLESERGYHMTLPHARVETRRPISFAERKFMVTPMAMGLRFAGTAEFAGLDATPNFKRANQLLTHAQRAFDGIDVADGSEWTGQRPATPDSLPVIGPATRFKNVFYAFGHGHLGLTAGAVTGKHIADLVAGRPAAIDLTPFRVDRFV